MEQNNFRLNSSGNHTTHSRPLGAVERSKALAIPLLSSPKAAVEDEGTEAGIPTALTSQSQNKEENQK